MNSVFKEYEVMYMDSSLESYLFYFGLWIWVIIYYVCLMLGYLILLTVLISPLFLCYYTICKIKIKIKPYKNKKCDKKHKEQLSKEYLMKLETLNNKKKKKHK